MYRTFMQKGKGVIQPKSKYHESKVVPCKLKKITMSRDTTTHHLKTT